MLNYHEIDYSLGEMGHQGLCMEVDWYVCFLYSDEVCMEVDSLISMYASSELMKCAKNSEL